MHEASPLGKCVSSCAPCPPAIASDTRDLHGSMKRGHGAKEDKYELGCVNEEILGA